MRKVASLPLINSFNRTEAAIFPMHLCLFLVFSQTVLITRLNVQCTSIKYSAKLYSVRVKRRYAVF